MIRRLLPIAVIVLVAAAFGADTRRPILPTAPVIDFRLPVFNKDGFKVWELRGKQALYVESLDRVEITGLHLKVFAADEAGTLENEVMSPFATVQISVRTISGPGQIRATGKGFEVLGEDWTYDDPAKNMVIRKNVVVTFQQEIGDILR